jgi:transposase
MAGVQVQQVAEALDIHPFMLSRWRKQVREGRLRGKHAKLELNTKLVSELRQLAQLRQRYALLKEEHELLKKLFGSVRKQGPDLRLHRQRARRTLAQCHLCVLRGHARGLLRVEDAHEEPAQ